MSLCFINYFKIIVLKKTEMAIETNGKAIEFPAPAITIFESSGGIWMSRVGSGVVVAGLDVEHLRGPLMVRSR